MCDTGDGIQTLWVSTHVICRCLAPRHVVLRRVGCAACSTHAVVEGGPRVYSTPCNVDVSRRSECVIELVVPEEELFPETT